MKKLLAIDGNSIINRTFYGIRPLSNSEGIPTNAIYGLLNILDTQIKDLQPDYAAIAFDVKHPTFRHEKYDQYKAGRHATPPDLLEQIPWAKKCCEAMNIKVIELPGWEADDILGTLAQKSEENDIEAYILTGDRDSLQLISDTTRILLATNNNTIIYDEKEFFNKYGVSPKVFVDVKALMGDSSDNIPGVPGIGEKTALKLISEYGSLDNVFDSYESSDLSAGIKKKLSEGKESAYLSQFLAQIDRQAPLPVSLNDLSWETYNSDELIPLLTRLGFSSFLKKMTQAVPKQPENTESETITSVQNLPNEPFGLYLENETAYFANDTKCFEYKYIKSEIRDLLRDSERQFYVFDIKSIAHLFDEFPKADVFDCALGAYVLNAQNNIQSIDSLSLTLLQKTTNDNPTIKAQNLFYLKTSILSKMNDEEKNLYYNVEFPLSEVLFNMEKQGFKVDREGLTNYSEYLTKETLELESQIYYIAGKTFNINSPKQLGEILFSPENLNLPHFKKTKSGYSTSAEILEKLKPYHPIIDKILSYRQLTKLNSTYAVGLNNVADKDGIIHTTFNQTITATGRLSSTEPNLQNIPIRTELGKEFRKFFIPHEGYTLIDADYSQIELRLLAALSNDTTMINAFNEGIDIHTLTASQVFGVFPEAVTPEMRKRAKAVNFGIVYGIGDFSLASDIGVTKKQAGEYIDNYLATYPEIDKYLKQSIQFAKDNGYVSTLFGRKRYIPELKSGKKMLEAFGTRVAMNSPVQGTAADIIKIAMINTYRKLKEADIDAKLILQVHDELIVEAKDDCIDKASEILKTEMENAYKGAVKLEVDINSAKTWYDAH